LPKVPDGLLPIDLEQIYALAQNDFQVLAGASLFMTGCTGLVGKWLVDGILWANRNAALDCRVTVLTRDAALVRRAMPHWAGGDSIIILEKNIYDLQREDIMPFTVAVHGLNLLNDGSPSWPLRHMETAFEGTKRFFELAAASGCRRMLLLSSGAVYNNFFPDQPAPFREIYDRRIGFEAHVYSETKRFMEFYTATLGATTEISVPIARLFTFFGPYMPLHARQALNSIFSDALHDRNIHIQGDGTAVRSYMYAADMAVWLLAVLARGRSGTSYNIGSELPINIKDLAALILEISGKDLKIEIQGLDMPGNAPSLYLPDTGRAKNELGLCQSITLREALERTWNWYSSFN
jgi:dTDP-glucose 4,6-dehydratase